MKRILAVLLTVSTLSASADTYIDEQTWVNVNAFFKLGETWKAYAEWQPRFFDYSQYNGVTLHRGALGRGIGSGLSLYGGYGFMTWNTRRDSKSPAKFQHEDRYFAMLLHSHVTGNWKLTNRTRFEVRQFRRDDELGGRLRHLLRIQYRFGAGPWAIALWDEYFYNTNSTRPSRESHAPAAAAGFDQNRAFLGGAYVFGDEGQHLFETGYMNNYVDGVTRDRRAHVWMSTLALSF